MKIRGLAMAGLLALLLLHAGCRKDGDFDIRGTWAFRTGATEHFVFTFSGTAEAGTVTAAVFQEGAGTYAVSGDQVTFDFHSTMVGGTSCDFSGGFVSDDLMEGTMDFTAPYPPFHWTQDVTGERR